MPVTVNSVVQVLAYLVLLLLITKPLGLYMLNVFSGKRTWLTPVFAPVKRFFYRLSGIDAEKEQKWTEYTVAMLAFSAAGMLLLYLQQRTQQWLPFNPQGFGPVEPQLAFNTAASFTSNTNWQA